MAIAAPPNQAAPPDRVEATFAGVAATSTCFRHDIERLLEPGGITTENLRRLAEWLDSDVWELMAANDAVLSQWARGVAQ